MKNIRIALMACLACLFATACQQEDEGDQVFTTNRFRVEAPQFTDADGSKIYLNFNDDASKLIYEENDIVYVNGHQFRLNKEGDTWYANSLDGNRVVGKRFLVAYADGAVSAFDSASGTYHYNLNTNLADAAHNKIVLGGTSASGTVLTLSPACAILRLNTQGAGRNYSYVKVGFEANKIPKQGTLNVSTRAINAGGNYMSPVMSNGTGDFLNMRYSNPTSTGEDDYWYVAIPIEGSSVTTTLYLEWNNGTETIKHKTQGEVTLQKGYVYTVGTERVSPFTIDGYSKCSYLVSPSTEVLFSAGNLQFQRYRSGPSYLYKWQFAENQRSYIGSSNVPFGNTKWLDLMGYGTSSYSGYEPMNYTDNYESYYNANLSGSNYDWGVFNSSNPGFYYGSRLVTTANWRTLTAAEWTYLINNRSGKSGLATVDGVKGLILLPDYGDGGADWSLSSALPTGSTVTFNASKASWTANVYTAEQWDELENAGAIFLPAAGYRVRTEEGSEVEAAGNLGYYWSATINPEDDYQGMALQITPGNVSVVATEKIYGCSVRLVIEVN